MNALLYSIFNDIKNLVNIIWKATKAVCFFIINFFKSYPLYLNVLMIFVIIYSLFGVILLNTPKRGELYGFYAQFVDLAIILAITGLVDLIQNSRAKHIMGYAFTCVFFLVMLTDFSYYDAFGTISSITDFKSITWVTSQDVGIQIIWNQVVLTLIFFLYSFLYIKKVIVANYYVEKRQKVNQYKTSVGFFILMCLTPFTTRLHFLDEDFDVDDEFYLIDYIASGSYLYENIPSRTSFAKKYGYVNYRLKDLSTLWNKIDQIETFQKLETYFSGVEYNNANAYTGLFKDKNLITIRLESFDTRLIDPVVTPNLYYIYNNSTTFSNYYLPAYQTGATCNTEFLFHTGIFPPLVGNFDKNICSSFSTTYYEYALPRQFGNNGYNTYYLHQGQRTYYNRDYILDHGYGFDSNNLHFSMTDLDGNNNSPYDTDMASFFPNIDWNEQFFVDIMTYSGHAGSYKYFTDSNGIGITADSKNQDDRLYSPRQDYSFNTKSNPGLFYQSGGETRAYNEYMASYLAKMYEVDAFIGMLLNAVGEACELENTIFMFTPDHWPYMFKENGNITDAGVNTYLSTISNSDYDLQNNGDTFTNEKDVYHQTFMIYDPSLILIPNNHENIVSSIDIYKTILNLFDDGSGTFEYKYGFGNDMFQLVEANENSIPIFADLSAYYNGHYVDFMSNADYTSILGYDNLVTLWNEKMNDVSMSLGIVVTNYFEPNA